MRKITISSLLTLICINTAFANIDWWNQITICRMDTTKCYPQLVTTAGIDTEMWDSDKGCRGIKYICPEALVKETNQPELIGILSLQNTEIVKADYDTDILSEMGNCYGQRKSHPTAPQVKVNDKYVNVYCNGALDRPDEVLENGEIVYENQPTCENLKNNGYIGVKNGNCYGKPFNDNEYYVECGNDLLPERIIVLNGADISNTSNGPIFNNEAVEIFNKMQSVSQSQKQQYFK